MTNPPAARPEPTTGTPYDSYLVPRSKTPEKTALYNTLLDLGWRFDSHTMLWHTPERATLQGAGRLEYDPKFRHATVQPPSDTSGEIPMRPEPLIRLSRLGHTMTWLVDGRA